MASSAWRETRKRGRLKGLSALCGLLAVAGLGGFFTSAVVASGFVRPPDGFECPAGTVVGAARLPDGRWAVPLGAYGRVQLYDAGWRFVRGWQVHARKGDFLIAAARAGRIEVYTTWREQHLTYNEEGRLISSRPLVGWSSRRITAEVRSGQRVEVPTPAVVWWLSSPFFCFIMGVAGGTGVYLMKRLEGGRARGAG